MSRVAAKAPISLALALASLLVASATWARPDDVPAPRDTAYDLSWWTADGGGSTFSMGDGYTLGTTIGQPDAAAWAGDGYTLAGGFWGGAVVEYRVYLPLVLRDF